MKNNIEDQIKQLKNQIDCGDLDPFNAAMQVLIIMNLKEKLSQLPIQELIVIAEPHTDYTDEAKTIALDLLNERKWESIPNLKDEIKSYWEDYISDNIKQILLNKTLPKSLFLNDEEMKTALKIKFEEWKERQELLGIDITKYWAVPF